MALSAFDDKTHRPSADDLGRTLGTSAPLWDAVVAQTSGPVRTRADVAAARQLASVKLST